MINLHKNIQRLNRRTTEYIKDPNEKNIHDVRTSIRRFDASFLTLPKTQRQESLLSQYYKIAREFFKVNSEIRDFDIIYNKLKVYPQNHEIQIVIDLLNKERQSKLEYAKTVALSLKNLESSKVIDKMNITEKELRKRYSKIVSKLIGKIEINFPIVIMNSSIIEELHELRKDCKKMKYMLELLSDENANGTELLRILQKIQDILGNIHDCDSAIDYLKSLNPNKEIQEIINNEIEQRKVKYQEFLVFSRKRLQISKDSFFIKIRNFKYMYRT